jgi:hypothetical protein
MARTSENLRQIPGDAVVWGGNFSCYRGLDVFFCSWWSHPENSLKLIVQKFNVLRPMLKIARPRTRASYALPLAPKSASSKVENNLTTF